MPTAIRDDWRLIVAVVSGGHFFSHFYWLTIPPLFPLLRREFGLSNAELGLVVSMLMVGGLLQAPVGNVVDRIGAKWVFATGVGVTAAGMALVGFGRTYPAILTFAAISGIGQSVFHPAAYALLDTVTEPGVRGKAFSVHTFSGFTGFAAAPVVVGTLASRVGWRATLFVVGAIGLAYALFLAVALVPVYRATIETNETGSTAETEATRSLLTVLQRPGIRLLVGFFLLSAFANKGIQAFTTVLAVDSFGLEESVGNTLLTAFFAFGSVGVLVGGVLADRYAPGRVIAGTLLVGASLLFVTVTGILPASTLPLVGLFGLSGFFITLIAPSRDQLVSEQSSSGSMGRSFGVVFTGGALGSLIGPVFLGAVADAASVIVMFVFVSALYLVVGALALAIEREWLHSDPGATPSPGD